MVDPKVDVNGGWRLYVKQETVARLKVVLGAGEILDDHHDLAVKTARQRQRLLPSARVSSIGFVIEVISFLLSRWLTLRQLEV